MINISKELRNLLESRECEIQVGVEFYNRNTIDISSIGAPKNAFARFSDTCFTWNNSTGSYEYAAKILEFPSVKTYLDGRVNEASIVIGNVAKGKDSGMSFIINNKLKGNWMVIRLIFPDIPDESWIVWWGKCKSPGKITEKDIEIIATQDNGSYTSKIPFRTYGTKCPLVPGKGDCLGNIPLEEHSQLYQQQYALYGTMLCPDRSLETCKKLGNEKFFQGQPAVAINGTFSYVSTDTQDDSNKKKKKSNISNLKTESWSSINQSESSSDMVPLGFGRFQLSGHPISWADMGTSIKALFGFCEGKIQDFDFIKCRTEGLTISRVIKHYGEYGSYGSQVPEVLFNGFGGYNSRLAYLEVIVDGSKPEEVGGAPIITSVIRGLEIPVPNENGDYISRMATDNPVHITRFILTDDKYGKIPPYRIADARNLLTAQYCDELIEDRTQSEWLLLPTNEYEDYGSGYIRYRSTGVWTALREHLIREERLRDMSPSRYGYIPITEILMEQPYITWYNPFGERPLLDKRNILRKRFTINGALQESTSILDFLMNRILPCFRGWLNYNRNGQIEIRTREPADNAYLRASSNKGTTLLPINNIKPWVSTFDGFLLIGVGVEHTEIRKVKSVAYSPGCNNMPIVVSTGGNITATVSPIEGGSLTNRGVGYIDFSGTVEENVEIKLTFNSTPDDFTIAYVTDGVESISTLTRIIGRYLNANPDFSNYLTAYTTSTHPNRLYIQCEAGFLELDKPLEYDHVQAEEVMRVEAVFENCGELDSDASSTFDNIIIDSFSWNTNEIDNTPNAYTCIYTSAIDDFNVAKILPRTYWDIVDLEGELNVEELDLKMIDNYWQAAYVTKTIAIENIYGKTQFNWRTGVSGFTLDIGDVVTIRHDSGDGAIRYLPLWIESISYNLKDLTTDITARLYISGAWNHQVQEVDQVLTVSLNPNFVPFTPNSTGTTGGYGWTTQSYWYPGLDGRIRINDNDYLAHDAWSPDTRWTKYGPSYVFNGMFDPEYAGWDRL